MYQTNPCHILQFSSFPHVTHPLPPSTFNSFSLFELLYFALPNRRVCASTSSCSQLLVYPFLRFRWSRPHTRNCSFNVFAESHGPCSYVFIPIPSLNPTYISKCSSPFILFLSASHLFLSISYFTSVLYPTNFSMTGISFFVFPCYSILSRLNFSTLF